MKINIIIAGRYKQRDDVEKLFHKYKQRLRETLGLLSKKYKFKMPKNIILRPMYVKGDYYPYFGRAQWSHWDGYEILMNIETCKDMYDKGFSVLDHECAHVASHILHANMEHGDSFKNMYAACRNKKLRKKKT